MPTLTRATTETQLALSLDPCIFLNNCEVNHDNF